MLSVKAVLCNFVLLVWMPVVLYVNVKIFFIPFFVPKWKNLDLSSYIQAVLTKERDTVPLGPGWGEELLFCLGMTDAVLSEHYSLHE